MAKETKNKLDGEQSFGILERMLKLIKKHGAWNIIKALMLIIFFFSGMWCVTHMDTIFEGVIAKHNAENAEMHENALKHRAEIKPKIDIILKNTLEEVNADRVFVIEMHNGTNSLSGLPFVYCEMTYETCRKGVMRVDDEYGSVVLSRYSLPYYMTENDFFCGSVEELEELDPKLSHRMRDNGTAYICVSNMYGVDDYIGYVGIGYTEGSVPPSKDTLKSEVFKLSQRITTLLDSKNLE